MNDIIDYYEKLSEEYGFKVDPPSHMLTFKGDKLSEERKTREAIEVFKLNVELHPDSANAYDSLGEAYVNSGDKKNAVKNYKKSLELNPENNNAKEMLKRLEKK